MMGIQVRLTGFWFFCLAAETGDVHRGSAVMETAAPFSALMQRNELNKRVVRKHHDGA